MRLIPTRSCGLSFGVSTGITCLLEIILSGAVGAVCTISWIASGKPTKYIYDAVLKDNYTIRNDSLEGCVVVWCLSIILAICIWRIIMAVILFICIQRNSSALGKVWIAYKVLALMISSFVCIASLTAPSAKIPAISSFVVDVITSYYMLILYPELEKMGRTIVTPKTST